MSSGIVNNKKFYNIGEDKKDLNFFELNKSKYEDKTYEFISDLINILFKYKNSYNSFLHVSTLLNLILNQINNKSLLKFYYSDFSGDTKDKYLVILKIIRSFLEKDTRLTNIQKSQCCQIERFLMKLYLKEFLEIL